MSLCYVCAAIEANPDEPRTFTHKEAMFLAGYIQGAEDWAHEQPGRFCNRHGRMLEIMARASGHDAEKVAAEDPS